jgi:hypothetical protein
MGTSGRLVLPDGLSRCDRDWFGVTRDVRRATPLHLQMSGVQRRCTFRGRRRRRVTCCLQRAASSVATDSDVASASGVPAPAWRYAAVLPALSGAALASHDQPAQAQRRKIMSRIFISGSTTGLGLMAGELLASQGHRVVLHARNADRAERTNCRPPLGNVRSVAVRADFIL